MARKKIPVSVRQLILLEAGYKCANPACRHIITLELHHIVWVKDGGVNEPENLLTLCPNCHSLHTAGHIPSDAIVTWKSLLASLNNPHRASADILLTLYQDEKRLSSEPESKYPPFRFTGDGLLMLSGLLVSGLIQISNRFSGANYFGGAMPSFEVRLTKRGTQLVEAWIAGQPETIVRVLTQPPDKNNGE
ncbi:MAG: HNH endonuclease signature motif containing protein [Chloroflexota bacterium]